MGFTWIFAGLCFLLTPCMNVIDLFPDFIGCLLIRKGLKKLSFLSDRMSEATVALRRVLTVSCGKVAALFVVAIFQDDTTTLLVTFVMSTLEILFTTPLIRELLEGAEDLGIRYDGKVAMYGAPTLRILLTVFLWARCLGAVLPEIFCLWNPLYTGELPPDYIQVAESMKSAKLISTLLQLVGVSVFAVFVGVYTRRLFLGMEREDGFCPRLEEAWERRFGSNEVLQKQLRLDQALVWLLGAAVLGFRVYLNRLNYLPDFPLFWALWTAARNLPDLPLGQKKTKRLLWILGGVATLCFALRSYGAAAFYPQFNEKWQALPLVYPLGLFSAVSLCVGLFFLVERLDDASLALYGRRRIKKGLLKTMAVISSLCAFVDYALPSLYDFMRGMNPHFPLYAKYATELVNIGFTWVGFFAYAIYAVRIWSLSSAMRGDLKLEMKY